MRSGSFSAGGGLAGLCVGRRFCRGCAAAYGLALSSAMAFSSSLPFGRRTVRRGLQGRRDRAKNASEIAAIASASRRARVAAFAFAALCSLKAAFAAVCSRAEVGRVVPAHEKRPSAVAGRAPALGDRGSKTRGVLARSAVSVPGSFCLGVPERGRAPAGVGGREAGRGADARSWASAVPLSRAAEAE